MLEELVDFVSKYTNLIKSIVVVLTGILGIIGIFKRYKISRYEILRKVSDDYLGRKKSAALNGFKSLYGRNRTMEDLYLFMYDPLIGQNFEIFIKVKWFLRRDKNGKYIPGFRYKTLEILIYLLLSILSIFSFLMGVAYMYKLSNSIDQFAPLKVALIFLLSLVPFLVTIYFINILVEMRHAKKIFGDK